MNENDDKTDAPRKYDPSKLRRDRQPGYVSVWRPVMTEQQRKEREQYVKDNNLPF